MANNEQKYDLTIARAYEVKNGFQSVVVDAETYDALQKVKVGGKLTLKIIPEEKRKHDKSPHAYFEYKSPEQVEEAKKFLVRNKQDNY